MLSYKFTYNGVTINDSSQFPNRRGVSLSDVTGLSSPEVKHREDDLLGQHGIVDFFSFVGKRLITMQGLIVGTDENDMFTLMEEFTEAFRLPAIPDSTDDGYHTLSWTKSGESTKQIQAKVHRLPRFMKTRGVHRMRRFLVELRCGNPRIVSSDIDTEDIYKSSRLGSLPMALPAAIGADLGWTNEETLVNDGNFGAQPTITIHGPCENPKIINLNKPDWYQLFELTLVAGESIVIDVLNGTATKDDGSNMLIYESDDSRWIELLPGNNLIRYETADNSPTSYIEIVWRDTWMSTPR